MSARSPFRRRLVGSALAGAVVAVGLVVVPGPVLRWVDDFRVDRHELRFTPAAEVDGTAISEVASGDPFVTIGLQLDAAPASPPEVRWRDGDGWSAWQELEIEVDKAPDRGTDEARRANSAVVTQPLWVGSATAYQVRVTDETAGAALEGAEALVVRPDGGHLQVDASDVPAGAESLGQPPVHTRGEWGARSPSASVGSASTLKLAVVHHSATANDYSPADVPGILRSIQAYHIDGNGWSDIGYNFAVDRFGGIWEARDGSLLRNSIGAHAEGFNTGSVGVVALGNTTAAAVTGPQLDGIAEVISWRFASSGIDPNSTVAFTSGGSSKYAAGTVVNLPRVVGHRDVGLTDCPGNSLYSALASNLRPRLPALVAAKSSPVGVLDTVAGGPGSIVVSGWALDPLVVDPIEIHLYLDGVGRNLGVTPLERPDLAATFPSSGTRHGFSTTLTGVSPGQHSVCVFGINQGPGSNTLIECRQVEVRTGSPFGSVDVAVGGPDGTLGVSGWAIDPDTAAPVPVHVYVDGRGSNLGPAGVSRGDLGTAFPAYGPGHGFNWLTGGLAGGAHDVCVFALNEGPGSNTLLSCSRITVPAGSPVGAVDRAQGGPDGQITVSGWSLDPDTAVSTPVHVYIDGRGINLGPAGAGRADVAAASPGYGPAHGYSTVQSGMAPGPHDVCVFAIDVRGGQPNSLLNCRRTVVPGGSPFGSIDAVDSSSGRVRVVGWVVDPDVTAPADVHVYVDGVGYNAGAASTARPDIVTAVPGYGSGHGLAWTSPVLAPGVHSVCVFGINVGSGGNRLLDCRNVGV